MNDLKLTQGELDDLLGQFIDGPEHEGTPYKKPKMRVDVRPTQRNQALNTAVAADRVTRFFPWLKQELDAIQVVRQREAELYTNRKWAKFADNHRMGRRIGRIPVEVFMYLQAMQPEILENNMLLRQFLRDNPQYAAVPKESI